MKINPRASAANPAVRAVWASFPPKKLIWSSAKMLAGTAKVPKHTRTSPSEPHRMEMIAMVRLM